MPGKQANIENKPNLPVVAFLAELFFEMAESEAVGLHESAVRDLLAAEEVGDHQLRARVGDGVSSTQPPLLFPPVEEETQTG